MSEQIDRAFEQALIRSMGGEDPIESAKLVHVSKIAFAQQEDVTSSLFKEDDRWEQRQSDMDAKGIKPTDQRWVEAQEVHTLLVASYKQQLKLLQKVGNPRGL